MFRTKRGDTLVSTIERQYGVDLNVRSDALLGNLLAQRGFDSLSQLIEACRGNARSPARKRRVFLSFHEQDMQYVRGFRLMSINPNLDLDIYDSSLRVPIDSEKSSEIKRGILKKLTPASVVLCLVGNGTGWREWVDWELGEAKARGKGICAVRIRETYGKIPKLIRDLGAPVVEWSVPSIIAAIECAAARRS